MAVRCGRWVPAAAMVLLLVGGCAGQNGTTATGDVPTPVDQSADPSPTDDLQTVPSALAEGFGAGASASPSRKAKPTSGATSRPRRKKPQTESQLPPPPPKPASPSCKPKHQGTKLAKAAVGDLLVAAAGVTYWPVSAPGLIVPANLVKAVAWQESGWQSDIVACDGGVGLMQVMPATADFVNTRFEKSYDIGTPADNAKLGANYLAWLTKYFGDGYFDGDYSLSSGACRSTSDVCLLNVVISAYNMGFGSLETDDGLVLRNPTYVANVRALMTECECLAY